MRATRAAIKHCFVLFWISISKSVCCEQRLEGSQFPLLPVRWGPSEWAWGSGVAAPVTVSPHCEALTRAAAANALTSCAAAPAGDSEPLKAQVVKLFTRGLSLLGVINSLTATLRCNEWTHTLGSNNYANAEEPRTQRIQVLAWIGWDSICKLTEPCTCLKTNTALGWRGSSAFWKAANSSIFRVAEFQSSGLFYPYSHGWTTRIFLVPRPIRS